MLASQELQYDISRTLSFTVDRQVMRGTLWAVSIDQIRRYVSEFNRVTIIQHLVF